MRLALLSNITVDMLANMVKEGGVDVYTSAGYDTWQQDVMMTASGLYSFTPQAVVILLYANAYHWNDYEEGITRIDEWCATFKALAENLPSIPLFVSSIDIQLHVQYGAEVNIAQHLEDYYIKKVEELHRSGIPIYVLPVKDSIVDMGRKNFYSSKMWYVGSMPYSIKGLTEITGLILRYIGTVKGMHKKCLAVDLDNTLWGGVIGEDGVDGIVLSNHKEGARYYDAQRILKKMKNQGVMLAILSKNNLEDVEPVFAHPDMVLQHEDFVAEVIDWEPKSVNIRQLAANLNIGLDAFVFLDDNPAERERMKAECPEVEVIDFPKNSALLPDALEKAYNEFFLALEVTGEDMKKTEMYRAEKLRKADQAMAVSLDDFLKKLEMEMDIHLMREEEEHRVVQLVNKTNQFNVTTKRYSEEEILALNQEGDIVTVHMSDKYGDQGLVAVLILKYADNEATIDTFLMSCRVMGRNAENEIVAQLAGLLEKKGVTAVHASYIRTKKNSPVESLYDGLGFTKIAGNDDQKQYLIEVKNLPTSTNVFKSVQEDWS